MIFKYLQYNILHSWSHIMGSIFFSFFLNIMVLASLRLGPFELWCRNITRGKNIKFPSWNARDEKHHLSRGSVTGNNSGFFLWLSEDTVQRSTMSRDWTVIRICWHFGLNVWWDLDECDRQAGFLLNVSTSMAVWLQSYI